MNRFNQCVAVITGAGSGIGQQLALQLAHSGARLAISDINASGLENTEELLKSSGAAVLSSALDVSDRAAVFHYAERVAEHYGEVNLVINNAGVALGSGPLWETSMEDFDWLMNINFYGVLSGCKAFLPHLQKAQWGHIVNVSSLYGLVSVAEQNAYNASKFAVRGLTEALRHELKAANSTVSCTSVHPGGIKTNISRNARFIPRENASEEQRQAAIEQFDRIARTSAEQAAKQILDAVEKDKMRLLIGLDAKFVDKIQRLFPQHYSRVFAWIFNALGNR